MKTLIVLAIFLSSLEAYAQSENLERPVSSEVQKVIKKCLKWDYSQRRRLCNQNILCHLKAPLVSEPVTVSCRCYIDYSDKHPNYSPDLRRNQNKSVFWRSVFWRAEGMDMDPQKAEEKARSICNNSFLSRLENLEYWITNVDHCFIMHSYTCEGGLIEKSTGQVQ